MQAALDASALMLSKDAQTMTAAPLAQKTSDDFKSVFNRPDAFNVQVSSQFQQPAAGNFSLKITASATINTVFSRLLWQSTMSMSASSQVLWGIKKLNLALVLDNTGSM